MHVMVCVFVIWYLCVMLCVFYIVCIFFYHVLVCLRVCVHYGAK